MTLDENQARLNALDTEIMERINSIAADLSTRVKVRISIRIDEERDLTFGKSNGKWQFIVETDESEWTLASSPRDERLEMVGHIARLIASADEQIAAMLPSREAAIRELDRLIASNQRTKES